MPPLPPMAWLSVNVVPEMEMVAPAALYTPPPRPAAAVATGASIAAAGVLIDWAVLGVPAGTALAAVAALRQIQQDRAIGEAQVASLVEYAAAQCIAPKATSAAVAGDEAAAQDARAACARYANGAVAPESLVVRDHDRGERHLAAGIHKAAAHVGLAVLDCQSRDLHPPLKT